MGMSGVKSSPPASATRVAHWLKGGASRGNGADAHMDGTPLSDFNRGGRGELRYHLRASVVPKTPGYGFQSRAKAHRCCLT